MIYSFTKWNSTRRRQPHVGSFLHYHTRKQGNRKRRSVTWSNLHSNLVIISEILSNSSRIDSSLKKIIPIDLILEKLADTACCGSEHFIIFDCCTNLGEAGPLVKRHYEDRIRYWMKNRRVVLHVIFTSHHVGTCFDFLLCRKLTFLTTWQILPRISKKLLLHALYTIWILS